MATARALRKLLACITGLLAAVPAAGVDNPLARPSAPTVAAISGRWNGVNLERRSACTSAQNDGNRGTYAQFDIVAEGNGNFSIAQSGITGLNCTYTGRFQPEGGALALQGSYACTDGKQGSFATGRLELHALSMDLRLAIQLTAGETCAIDSILGMARFPQ